MQVQKVKGWGDHLPWHGHATLLTIDVTDLFSALKSQMSGFFLRFCALNYTNYVNTCLSIYIFYTLLRIEVASKKNHWLIHFVIQD